MSSGPSGPMFMCDRLINAYQTKLRASWWNQFKLLLWLYLHLELTFQLFINWSYRIPFNCRTGCIDDFVECCNEKFQNCKSGANILHWVNNSVISTQVCSRSQDLDGETGGLWIPVKVTHWTSKYYTQRRVFMYFRTRSIIVCRDFPNKVVVAGCWKA